MNWYYCRDGKVVEGPLEESDLLTMAAQGELPPSTMVVAVGSEEWKRLNSISPPSPPLAPPASPPPIPGSSGHPSSAAKSWFAKLSPLRKAAVVIGGGFVALVILGLIGGGGNQAPGSPASSQAAQESSDGISPQEAEMLLRMADAAVPKNRYPCSECGGSGQKDNTGSFRSTREGCGTCSGRGTIRTPSGYESTCPTCSGLGSPKTLPCHKCGGSGQVWGY
jgi:hypothetical protein